MFCTNCGAALRENARFCMQCGAPVRAAAAASAVPAAPAVPDAPASAAPVAAAVPAAPASAAPVAPAVPAVPAVPATPVETPEQRAFREMRRSYHLSYLGGMVTYGVQSQVISTLIGVIFGIFFGGIYSYLISELIRGSSDLFGLPEQLQAIFSTSGVILALHAVYALIYTLGLVGGIAVSRLILKRLPVEAPEVRPLSVGKFLLIALACFGVWGVGALLGNFPAFFASVNAADYGWAAAPTWLVTVLVAPIAEELIFRKFMLDRLRIHGERYAVLASALLFGMAHQNGMQFFLAFGLGIVFALVYLRTGKIVYTMLLHGMINLFATLDTIGCLCFGNGFDRWWLLAAGVLILGGIVVLIVFRKRIPRPTRETIPDARRAAFGGWSMTLCKVIVLVSVASYGLLYAGLAYASTSSALSLLYLVPAALCFVTILLVSRKKAFGAKPCAAPCEAAADGESTEAETEAEKDTAARCPRKEYAASVKLLRR